MKEKLSTQTITLEIDREQVGQLVGAITHRAGQLSKNTPTFAVQIRNCLWHF